MSVSGGGAPGRRPRQVPVARGGGAARRFPRRSYHPSQKGSPRKAAECLAASPVARAAAGAAGRAVPV